MAGNQPDLEARSPWSQMNDVKEVEIHPAEGPIHGEITIPGSKSLTNRALIIAALAAGSSTITGILRCDDSYWCIETLRKLGVSLQVQENTVSIEGIQGEWPVQQETLYIGAAGTIARFLPSALAASDKGSWIMTAGRRMSERPIRPLIEALNELGANIKCTNQKDSLPISIEAGGIHGGEIEMSGSTSSQFISGLLMAAPYAKQRLCIRVKDAIVQHAYVNLTLDMMKYFGASVQYDDALHEITVEPVRYQGQELQLEADASTSCYFLALAAVTCGKIRILNLTAETKQPDIGMLDVFERMGCTVLRGRTFIELQGPIQLKGGFSISMKEMSDQTMTLAALAPFADGPISITEVAHIRMHESDRIRVMCDSLTQMGIQVEEREDGLTVYPGKPQPALLDSFDDHRIAMSLSLIAAVAQGIRITDPGCVSKTCPTFFKELQALGLRITRIESR